ncbi:MAG TPA: TOMM precursor leader peptide-binding protein [Ktedonobacteraceae bacterium]|nr:TOMM precursor leader peptide-binding protein [Ktedonobacteraceae bacterium]
MDANSNSKLQEPVHIVPVGAFGQAIADVLKELLPDVVETKPDPGNKTSPALWPVARVNILAAWRPVPQLNRLCEGISYAWKKHFIPVVLEDRSLRVGPVVVPGMGACYRCYEKRLLQHSPRQAIHSALRSHYEAHPQSGPAGYLAPFAEIAAIRLAQFIARLDADPASEAGRLWQMDIITRQTLTARVVGVHGCPRCGLHRDEATRSYMPLQQELAQLLSERTVERELVGMNGHGGKVLWSRN